MSWLKTIARGIWNATKTATRKAWHHVLRPAGTRLATFLGASQERCDALCDQVEVATNSIVDVLETEVKDLALQVLETAQRVLEAWFIRRMGEWGTMLIMAADQIAAWLNTPPPKAATAQAEQGPREQPSPDLEF